MPTRLVCSWIWISRWWLNGRSRKCLKVPDERLCALYFVRVIINLFLPRADKWKDILLRYVLIQLLNKPVLWFQDEVLAVSRKMVVRVEDLVQWSCGQPAGWSSCLKVAPCGTNGLIKPPQISDGIGIKSSEPLKDKPDSKKHWRQTSGCLTGLIYCSRTFVSRVSCLFLSDDLVERQSIKVLSYPQYCRFRSLQRRIQDGARGPVLQDPHLLALGAIKALPSTRLMYCRDTFNHPTLEGSASFSWQFSECDSDLQGYWGRYLMITSLYIFLGKDFASSWSEDDWILCFLVQDVRLSVFEGDLARGEAETAKTPRPPASQSPGSRRWRFVLHSNHSYLNLCIKPCKNNQRCFTLKTCLCDVNITNCCIFCVYLSAHETVIWSLCGSGKSPPGGPGTTQQHNDILKMTAEFNPNCWLTFQASLELLFQGRVVPSIFMFLLTGSTDFSFIWNHMPLCVFLFKSWTCFLSGECDGQRGGRLWGQLAPSPWRAAVPGSALRLHGATGLANPQSPKPRLQEEWVSSFSVFLALFLSKVNVWVFKHLMNDRRSQVRFIPIMHSAGVVGRWPRI